MASVFSLPDRANLEGPHDHACQVYIFICPVHILYLLPLHALKSVNKAKDLSTGLHTTQQNTMNIDRAILRNQIQVVKAERELTNK